MAELAAEMSRARPSTSTTSSLDGQQERRPDTHAGRAAQLTLCILEIWLTENARSLDFRFGGRSDWQTRKAPRAPATHRPLQATAGPIEAH